MFLKLERRTQLCDFVDTFQHHPFILIYTPINIFILFYFFLYIKFSTFFSRIHSMLPPSFQYKSHAYYFKSKYNMQKTLEEISNCTNRSLRIYSNFLFCFFLSIRKILYFFVKHFFFVAKRCGKKIIKEKKFRCDFQK